ncbi:hypothetical protein QBC42DRAFT_283570 [Cladorrhinum samala]|uniref:ATP synthase subunit K, mitochondrial n=1 Tax=Cladorrhinum samala TaxID=585594 RepID=A0AAV9HZI8_9PEZI|nr:hypothetical protein QBC42DRAFT_283570 [Cladorrhinum samala]
MGAQMYNVFGKQVGSHYLAIGTLAALFGGAFVSTRGGSKAPPASPPIVAASSDEADFIKKFLEEQDKAAPAAAKH